MGYDIKEKTVFKRTRSVLMRL